MGNSHTVAASFPLEIGELKMRCKPLTDEQIEELNEYVRDQYVQGARKRIPSTLSQAERMMEMRIVHETAAGLDWTRGVGATMMASRTGTSRIIWTMARDNWDGEGKLTHEMVHKAMVEETDVAQANDVFRRAHNLGNSQARRGRSRPRTGLSKSSKRTRKK